VIDYQISESPVEFVGALGFDRDDQGWITPRRLPDWTRNQFADAGIERMAKFPSGVRLCFRTRADQIYIHVQVSKLVITGESEVERPAAFDLLVNGQERASVLAEHGNILRLTSTALEGLVESVEPGAADLLKFDGLGDNEKEIEIWLPTTAIVAIASISATSEIHRPASQPKKRWVHYGSSISQCSEADRPMDAWPIQAAQLLKLHLINFGLAGECQLDGFVARTIAETAADFISLKLGINIVNADSMRERTFIPAVHNLLDTVRQQQPTTPILVISPVWCPFHENTPGPTLLNAEGFYSAERPLELAVGTLTLTRVRTILAEIVKKRMDENLHYMDGLELFSSADQDHMPDSLHPDSFGYRLMGERFAALQHSFIQTI
jgi:hypothetical protein